jgi:hypothetical protein
MTKVHERTFIISIQIFYKIQQLIFYEYTFVEYN